MTPTVIFDSSAIIAVERGDARMTNVVAAMAREAAMLVLPCGAIVETWRGSARNARLERLLRSAEIAVLDMDAAKRSGALLAKAPRASPIDATVVEVAMQFAPSMIVTSDLSDMRTLLQGTPAGAVTIYKI
jgi:hypothetical protein